MAVTDVGARLLTAHDLLRLSSQGVRGELIRGVLCETMPTGREHGQIVANLVLLLGNFIKPRRLGILTASDSGVWLERDPDTVREPDIAFFAAEMSPLDDRVTGYAEVAPDLVVEIASPGDSRREVERQGFDVAQPRRSAWPGWCTLTTRTVDVHRTRSIPSRRSATPTCLGRPGRPARLYLPGTDRLRYL